MGAMKKSSAKKQHESIKKRQQQNEESLDEHEQVDYAATADMLASDAEEDSASEDFQERIGGESDDESPEKENSDDESVEEQEDMNVSDDDDDTDNDEGENSDEEMDDDDRETSRPINNDIRVPGDEPCTFDLRNLLGVSSHPIDSSSLYDPRKKNADVSATIPLCYAVNEHYLLKKAEAGCNQIISALWQLPIVRSDAGPMVQLPSFDDSKIPRALVRIPFHNYG